MTAMPRCHVVNELGKMAHQGQIDRLMRHPGLDQTIGCLRRPKADGTTLGGGMTVDSPLKNHGLFMVFH